MGKTNFIIILKIVSVILMGFFLVIFLLYGCASRRPQLGKSQYSFHFKGKVYQIQSIFSLDKRESCNELVGENFKAIDFDQDRIIDRIVLGDLSLNDAQKIYEYGLDMVTKEKKLRVQPPVVNHYVHKSYEFDYEIRSFRPANSQPFNEFKVIDKRQVVPSLIIIIDQNADGTLDEVLKGMAVPEKMQPQYSEVIKEGLKKKQLIKVDHMILVKEK